MSDDSSNSNGFASWVKWLVGIIISLLAAGGGIVALLNYFNPPELPPTDEPTSTLEVCYIAGVVYNKDDNKPLPNVEVAYLRHTQDENEYTHGVRSHLATTDPKGRFEADCSRIEPENFPLRLILSHSRWQNTFFQTNEYIQRGEQRSEIYLYVSDSVLRTTP